MEFLEEDLARKVHLTHKVACLPDPAKYVKLLHRDVLHDVILFCFDFSFWYLDFHYSE